MNGADLLCDALLANGVDVCFANPGTSEMHFVAALDRRPEMRCVLGLFEGVVTGAADGYARMADKPAATLLHLGPGLTNALANVHNAKRAGTPMINVVGNHATYHQVYDAPLSSDVEALARPMSAWVGNCETAGVIGTRVNEAWQAAMGTPGVATLVLPADSAWNDAGDALPVPATRPVPPPFDAPTLAAIRAAVARGDRIALLIDGPALRAGLLETASRIATRIGARLLRPTSPARIERGAGRVSPEAVPYPLDGSVRLNSLALIGLIWKGVGMSKLSPFRYFKTSPEVIRLAVMLYVRFPLSLRNVEDLLHERGIDVSHETVRFWWNRFGPMFAAEIRRKRASRLRSSQQWRWHLDEVFVKIRGKTHYLWRAVDHEGEVLESVVTKTRDRRAAVRFLKKLIRRYGKPKQLVTDRLRAYGAALKELGLADERECTRHANNRAENSHLPFRRRERAMLRFRRMRSLQKFVAVHAAICNHFNLDRSLTKRTHFKSNRTAALWEWRQVCAG